MKKSSCGIKGLRTPSADHMHVACEKHDDFYIKNKLHGDGRLRKIGDDQFNQDMKDIIKTKPLYLKPLLHVQRTIYYGLVRVLGWVPWNNKKNGI